MKNLMQLLTIILLLMQSVTSVKAQQIQLKTGQEQEIDALFKAWNKDDSPGVSVGVLSGNTPIYLKGFGQEKLACNSAITPNSTFRLGGMAQHFTAFAILLLAENKQLSLNDDICKHLPDFPKREQQITIQHLLTHSSGLPSYWSLKELAGYGAADNFSSKESYDILKQHWELNHTSGQKYVFKGTGAALLAQIIQNITGQTLNDYMQQQVFKPLSMNNSFFIDDKTAISQTAEAHTKIEEQFVTRTVNHNAAGAAAYVTSMSDMMKWYKNIQNPRVGSKKMMQQLDAVMKLSNGTEAGNYNGKMTYGQQFMHLEKGINKIWDYGALGGYASSVFRFPAYNLTIAVFSNTGMTYNGFLGMGIAEILLKDKFQEEEKTNTVSNTKPSYIKLSEKEINAFVGNYFDNTTYTQRLIAVKNDTLRYIRPNYDTESALVPISSNTLHMLEPHQYITAQLETVKDKKMLTLKVGEESYVYEKYQKVDYSAKQLSQFEGLYYCQELNTMFELVVEDGALTAKRPKSKNIALNAFQKDRFLGSTEALKHLQFNRHKTRMIKGFTVSSDIVKKVYFKKLDVR